MSVYEFHKLKPELYLIVWCDFPTALQGEKFLQELQAIVEHADRKVCFLSDLRRGYIKDTLQISKLSKVIAHPNCGPTTAFGSMGSQVFVGVTHRLLQRAQRNDFGWATLRDALKYLEEMQPGITADIEWDKVVAALV